MELKTVAELTRDVLDPNRAAKFVALRAPTRAATILKVQEAQKAYVDARGEAIVSLTNLGFAAGIMSAGVTEIGHIISLKEGFLYRDAATYQPNHTTECDATSVFKVAAARLIKGCADNSWKYCNSLQSHGLYLTQLEKTFQEMKTDYIKVTSERCKAQCLEMSNGMSELGARVRTLLTSHEQKVDQWSSYASALKTYAHETLGASHVSYEKVTTQGRQNETVSTSEFFTRIEERALDLIQIISKEIPERSPAIQAILKHHGRIVAEQLEERPYSFTPDESLVLQHFSLNESLDNKNLRPAVRREYTELAEIVALSLVELSRRDRADAVKNLHRVSKQLGWALIPEGINDAYWQTLGVAAPAPAALEEAYKPVKEALAPFLKHTKLRTDGMKPAQLERTIAVGTVERTLAAVSAVAPEGDLAVSILASNPKLFIDYQQDQRAFLRFTELLQGVLPKVEAARSQGRNTLPAQISSSDAILRWTEGEGRVEAFKATRAEMVQVLRTLGFGEPELALQVLRAGCLIKGTYGAASERTFDQFARRELEKTQQHRVAAIRTQLVKAGLLNVGHGGQLTLASGHEGDRKKLLTWIKNNLPTSDLA